MKHQNPITFFLLCLGLIVAALQLVACGQNALPVVEASGPATINPVEGTDLSRVTLTEMAAKRLDIQTATVVDINVSGSTKKVIPYAAVLYDSQGTTWTYINP